MEQFNFYGQAWSLWPPSDPVTGGLNVVSGLAQISHAIISVCLIRKGEDPLHPDFGLAPDLFQPASDYEPEYLVYNLEKEIVRWVEGIQSLKIQISGYDAIDNKLKVEVYFVARDYPVSVLTFPYYSYRGALIDGGLNQFIRAVHLNGQPFFSLTSGL